MSASIVYTVEQIDLQIWRKGRGQQIRSLPLPPPIWYTYTYTYSATPGLGCIPDHFTFTILEQFYNPWVSWLICIKVMKRDRTLTRVKRICVPNKVLCKRKPMLTNIIDNLITKKSIAIVDQTAYYVHLFKKHLI